MGQDIREVDLVDPTEEVDDDRTGGRQLRHALAEEHERQEQAEARSRVRLEEEVDRPVIRTRGGGGNAERREDAVVDRVVQEEDLRDLDRDVGERQQAGLDDRADPIAEGAGQGSEPGPEEEHAERGEDRAEDAGREVVHEHLEAGPDPIGEVVVEELDQEGADRPHDHRPEEHRDAGADSNPEGRDRADDAAAMAVDELAARVADQQRDHEVDHRPDDGRDVLVGSPAGRDDERRDQSPGEDRADVG